MVFDVSAEEAEVARWHEPSTDISGGAEDSSDSTEVGKGVLELGEENAQETN